MNNSLDQILDNQVLSEDVKNELEQVFEARIQEHRETITAELREEFANRYENDKAQIVEAMDAMLKDALREELEEFHQDKAQAIKERIHYRQAVSKHSKVLEQFIKEILVKEIKELREDRKLQKGNVVKLEEFVVKNLTKELNEFHQDKRTLVEAKVKMIREGKKVVEDAKKRFIVKSASKVENILEDALKSEMKSLREDIQTAKENEFGRKIFETFAKEFMSNTLSEKTQVSKLVKEINRLRSTINENKVAMAKKDGMITEAQKQARIAKDTSERKAIINEMLQPLSKSQRSLMNTLLETVKTQNLKTAFKKYLPEVISEETTSGRTQRTKLTEASSSKRGTRQKELTGDKVANHHTNGDGNYSEELEKIRHLAGVLHPNGS